MTPDIRTPPVSESLRLLRDLLTPGEIRHALVLLVCMVFTAGIEVVGIAGLLGSGRTELLQSIFGALPKIKGEIKLNGQTLRARSPMDAMNRGIAYVPEAGVAHSHAMTRGEWRFRFYINGLAAEYARRRVHLDKGVMTGEPVSS